MKIAVMIPCLNEEAAIKKVVRDFQSATFGADVYVLADGDGDRGGASLAPTTGDARPQ